MTDLIILILQFGRVRQIILCYVKFVLKWVYVYSQSEVMFRKVRLCELASWNWIMFAKVKWVYAEGLILYVIGRFNSGGANVLCEEWTSSVDIIVVCCRITAMHLPLQSKWLYVGTERGNIHVVNIETFALSGYVINWNKAIELWVFVTTTLFDTYTAFKRGSNFVTNNGSSWAWLTKVNLPIAKPDEDSFAAAVTSLPPKVTSDTGER